MTVFYRVQVQVLKYKYLTTNNKQQTRQAKLMSKRKFPPQFRMYLKQADLDDFKMLKTIAEREGKSAAEIVRELVTGYVRLHEPGNPQQRLDTIMRLGKAYHAPNKICGFKNCLRDSVAVGMFIPNGKEYAVCPKHLETDVKTQPKLWKML